MCNFSAHKYGSPNPSTGSLTLPLLVLRVERLHSVSQLRPSARQVGRSAQSHLHAFRPGRTDPLPDTSPTLSRSPSANYDAYLKAHGEQTR